MSNKFSDRLKDVMKEQSISQSDLSRMTGIGRSNISQYIAGVNYPRSAAMNQIARALNIPLGWLIGEFEEPEKSLSVIYAAKVLNVIPQKLRGDLQKRRVPFGYALNKNGKYRYFISPTKFQEYLRKEVNQNDVSTQKTASQY